tara:strand:+ start:70 stop:570 length:501 start_codon:yes stop_codon:yes gene_type:complete
MSTIKVNEVQHTGGTTSLTIDSSGRILQPTKPAFMARGNNNAYVQTTPIPFPSVDFNIGSHYNNSTYKFTCPVDGVYMFGANVYYRCDAGELALIRFMKNTSTNIGNYSSNTAGSGAAQQQGTLHLTGLFQLSASDTVEVLFRDTGTPGDYYNGTTDSGFWGCLIG